MSKGLEQYKAFIDGLAERKDAVEAAWIRESGYRLSRKRSWREWFKMQE